MLVLGAVLAVTAIAASPPSLNRDVGYLERLLGRAYSGATPHRSTGACLWTAYPQGWGFCNDVHYVHLSRLDAFHIDLDWNGATVLPGAAWTHVSHLETWALPPGDLALNPAGSGLPAVTGPSGYAWVAVDGDRRDLNLWRGDPDATGSTWLRLDLAAPTALGSVVVSLIVDAGKGYVLPSDMAVEWLGPSGWTAVVATGRAPALPAAGANRISFVAVTTTALRVRFSAAAAIAVAELEAYGPGAAALALVERKFIADDDVLVAVVSARNLGDTEATLAATVSSALAAPVSGGLAGELDLGVPVSLRLEVPGAMPVAAALERQLRLAPGASAELRVAMAFAPDAVLAAARVAAHLAEADPVAAKAWSAGRWFLDEVPQLDVPDPWFEKTWAYRFELMRRNLTNPGRGRLTHPTFLEGRSTASWAARVITYGAPHQLDEARWLRDPAIARGHALTFVDNQRGDGAFQSVLIDGVWKEYTDWIASAIRDVYLVTGDTDLLARAFPAMAANVAYTQGRDDDGDGLPTVHDHYMTGMEWQPSFFALNGYDTSVVTPLERVDDAVALYANALATAESAAVLCRGSEAEAAAATAARVRQAVEAKMWDPATTFYYSLRAADDARSPPREIVGFYPFAFGLAAPDREPALKALFDPAEFWTPYPPATSSLSCPATSQDGWPLGPGGSEAMWNGPTWPHATSVVAEAVARTLRRSGEQDVTRAQLYALLESYTHAQYWGSNLGRDFDSPGTGEYYHGALGYWKTGQWDYFHSTYADLVIRFLIGLDPGVAGAVRIDPLIPPGTWNHFLLQNVRYRGHDLTIAWDASGGEDSYGDGREGLDLWVDGQLAASRTDLGLLEVPLAPSILLAIKAPGGVARFIQAQGPTPWSLFRAALPSLAAAEPVAGGPLSVAAVDDVAPPAPIAYYRIAACGGD